MGDFGGVKEVLDLIFATFYGPLISHIFMTKAISQLYMAKTTDESMFRRKKGERADKREAKFEKYK